jgi:hypothetical protein
MLAMTSDPHQIRKARHSDGCLGRVWAQPDPKTLKADHECSKAFAQLATTIRRRSRNLETH